MDRPLKIIYTILPEFGGVYGWMKSNGKERNGVGPCVTCSSGWYGEHPISQDLEDQFSEWQTKFESEVSVWGNDEVFDWSTFHNVGLDLCFRLTQEIGDVARIIYEKASEDPNCDIENRREIFADGSVLVLQHRSELGFGYEDN